MKQYGFLRGGIGKVVTRQASGSDSIVAGIENAELCVEIEGRTLNNGNRVIFVTTRPGVMSAGESKTLLAIEVETDGTVKVERRGTEGSS